MLTENLEHSKRKIGQSPYIVAMLYRSIFMLIAHSYWVLSRCHAVLTFVKKLTKNYTLYQSNVITFCQGKCHWVNIYLLEHSNCPTLVQILVTIPLGEISSLREVPSYESRSLSSTPKLRSIWIYKFHCLFQYFLQLVNGLSPRVSVIGLSWSRTNQNQDQRHKYHHLTTSLHLTLKMTTSGSRNVSHQQQSF